MDSYPDAKILVPVGKKQASAGFVEMHFKGSEHFQSA
jgi:hypothetical protein